jgi:hypothetical protein
VFCPFCILLRFFLVLFMGVLGNNLPDNIPLLYQILLRTKFPVLYKIGKASWLHNVRIFSYRSLHLSLQYNHMWPENISLCVPVAHDVEVIGRLPQKLEHVQHNNIVAKHLRFVWSISLHVCNSSLWSRYVLDDTDLSVPACLLFSRNELLSTPAFKWPILRSAQFRTIALLRFSNLLLIESLTCSWHTVYLVTLFRLQFRIVDHMWDLKKTGEGRVVYCLKIIYRISRTGTEENHKY